MRHSSSIPVIAGVRSIDPVHISYHNELPILFWNSSACPLSPLPSLSILSLSLSLNSLSLSLSSLSLSLCAFV